MKRQAARLLPPLALMGLIFFLSAQPNLGTGLGSWDVVLRKAAHILEFGLLALLWYWAFTGDINRRSVAYLAVAVAIAATYAISDELHQRFVTGRSASPIDVLIDSVGIALAGAWITRRRWSRRTMPSGD